MCIIYYVTDQWVWHGRRRKGLTKKNINCVLKAAKSFNFLMSSFNPGRWLCSLRNQLKNKLHLKSLLAQIHIEEDYIPKKICEAYWNKNWVDKSTIKQNNIGSKYKKLYDVTPIIEPWRMTWIAISRVTVSFHEVYFRAGKYLLADAAF